MRLNFSAVHIGTNNRATTSTQTEKSWAPTFSQFPTLWYWSDRGSDGGEHYLATPWLTHTHTHTQSKHAEKGKEKKKQCGGGSRQKITWEKKIKQWIERGDNRLREKYRLPRRWKKSNLTSEGTEGARWLDQEKEVEKQGHRRRDRNRGFSEVPKEWVRGRGETAEEMYILMYAHTMLFVHKPIFNPFFSFI